MSHHDDTVKLRHILDSAVKATAFTKGKTRMDLDGDEQLALALVRLLEIVGEAAAQVSESFQAAHSDIPWLAMRGTRNRLIHGYFDVDYDIVWQIVTQDFPPLIKRLKKLLS